MHVSVCASLRAYVVCVSVKVRACVNSWVSSSVSVCVCSREPAYICVCVLECFRACVR